MPETDKRGPNCLKRDKIDQKGSKDLLSRRGINSENRKVGKI